MCILYKPLPKLYVSLQVGMKFLTFYIEKNTCISQNKILKKFKILTKFCKNNYLYVNWLIFMSLNHMCFVWLKNISIQCIWRALDYEITFGTQDHETWNCQEKNHIASTKFQTQSCNGIQNLFGIFGSHIIVLVKKPTKKVAYNLSSKLEKLCNNLFMQEKWKRLRSCNLSTSSKETLSKCSLCLPKCKLKNYVVTFAHLFNCTCYAHTPI